MKEEYNFSEWQEGPPPHDGVWQIKVIDDYTQQPYIYYAKFQDGQWGAGTEFLNQAKEANFYPYAPNNDPLKPIRWRGRLPD